MKDKSTNHLQAAAIFLLDLWVILRGVWMILLFAILSIYAFIGTNQGHDILRAMIEDMAALHIGTYLWLMAGLFLWSGASALACRWMMYLTDNSGRSLSLERVSNRKYIQANLSYVAMMFPYALLFFALLKTTLAPDDHHFTTYQFIAIGLIVLSLVGLALISNASYSGKLQPYPSLFTPIGVEKEWSDKLYGIFNDVRIDMSTEEAEHLDDKYNLPADTLLPNGIILPSVTDAPWVKPIPGQSTFFTLMPGYPKQDSSHGEPYVWMYRIPVELYKHLMAQLYASTAFAVFVILLMIFLPSPLFMNLGTAAILCLAFGAWIIVTVFIRFLDKIRVRWRYPVPIRVLLLALFIITSFVNADHPARTLTQHVSDDQRIPVEQHFYNWLARLEKDSNSYREGDRVPVFFIAAEGGALRTGAFTSMVLAKLMDKNPLLAKHIYCYSAVSGGTVGVNFVNALLHSNEVKPGQYSEKTVAFFKNDFLSAVINRMVFGEVVNYFIPIHFDNTDRAVALETGFEDAWHQEMKDNKLSQPFSDLYKEDGAAVFINTVEVESGLQAVWSIVKLTGLPFPEERDLVHATGTDLRYSTAIGLSARFPIISPGAALHNVKANVSWHYVDGGYYENKGSETLLQVLRAIKVNHPDVLGRVAPYVLQFNFGDSADRTPQPVRAFNEVSEVVAGLYDTRGGRAKLQEKYLKDFVDSIHSRFYPFFIPFKENKFPMNWVISNSAMDSMSHYLDRNMDSVLKTKLPQQSWYIPRPTIPTVK